MARSSGMSGTCAVSANSAEPPPERSFDTNGTIGTRGPHVAQPSPDPAADGPQGWRDALLSLFPDRDPCPASGQTHGLAFGPTRSTLLIGRASARSASAGQRPSCSAFIPWSAADCCGALMLSNAGQVASVETDLIRYANGLALRRSFGSGASVPVWTFGRADALHLRRP
jgi:hypothetical protein